MVQAGKDLYKVQVLLGHKTPIMTQRYAHHYPESLRDGVEGLDRLKKEHVTNLSQSNEKGGNLNGYPLDLFGGADRIRTGDLRVAKAKQGFYTCLR